MINFQWKPGLFGYYVMRLWILLNLNFIWNPLIPLQQWKGALHYCQIGIEVQFWNWLPLPLVCVGSQWRASLLGVGRISSSPVSLKGISLAGSGSRSASLLFPMWFPAASQRCVFLLLWVVMKDLTLHLSSSGTNHPIGEGGLWSPSGGEGPGSPLVFVNMSGGRATVFLCYICWSKAVIS